ncbi:hypothetical protein BDR06DRAFT_1003582 [Suillus hirtellus]|nr:hypothetical protein BDR06DRAFT_1003582 [Suillus hirtellus]
MSQQTTLPTGHKVLDANHAINTSQQATLPAGLEVANLNDHSGQQDNNKEAPLNSHVETALQNMNNIFKMLDGLTLRTGIYTCLFTSHGHVYDTVQAMWFSTDNVMDFWEDVLQTEADKIVWKLEQWACMAGQRTIAKQHNICINYTNFDIAMKDKLAIDLKG